MEDSKGTSIQVCWFWSAENSKSIACLQLDDLNAWVKEVGVETNVDTSAAGSLCLVLRKTFFLEMPDLDLVCIGWRLIVGWTHGVSGEGEEEQIGARDDWELLDKEGPIAGEETRDWEEFEKKVEQVIGGEIESKELEWGGRTSHEADDVERSYESTSSGGTLDNCR